MQIAFGGTTSSQDAGEKESVSFSMGLQTPQTQSKEEQIWESVG